MHVHRGSFLSHGYSSGKTPNAFSLGKETYPALQLCSLKKENESMSDQRLQLFISGLIPFEDHKGFKVGNDQLPLRLGGTSLTGSKTQL